MQNFSEKNIISASRRTDIPAFYGEWFLKCVNEGFAQVRSPFSSRIQTVSLIPELVSAIVFWSKNYRPFSPILAKIEKVYDSRFLFHLTINGFSRQAKHMFEPNVPDWSQTVVDAKALTERYGVGKVLWRFDPIIFSNLTPPGERLDTFAHLAELLHGVVTRCYISFIDMYGKVKKRLNNLSESDRILFSQPSIEEQAAFLQSMNSIATQSGIKLFTCCEDIPGSIAGIAKGHCIDANLLKSYYPKEIFTEEIYPTRKECGCYLSIDIGAYNTCRHHCLYCYANR